jgi:hypothetical protein
VTSCFPKLRYGTAVIGLECLETFYIEENLINYLKTNTLKPFIIKSMCLTLLEMLNIEPLEESICSV